MKNLYCKLHISVKSFYFIVLVLLLILCLNLLLLSFEQFFQSKHFASSSMELFSSPFFAIILGALATAFLNSSSITITIVAIMVAAGLPLSAGIFFVLGANVGTSIRSSLVKTLPTCNVCDYRRMTNASSLNYFNNIVAFIFFFPLQVSIDYLGRMSLFTVELISQKSQIWTPVSEPFVDWPVFIYMNPHITDSSIVNLIVFIIFTMLLMKLFFIALRLIFDPMISRLLIKYILSNKMGKTKNKVLITGIWSSVLLQSSSSVMHIIMPLARQLQCNITSFYPLILGINVGTCFTTILFALILNSQLALAIGIAHLYYNLGAMLLFSYVPLIKELPMLASRVLSVESCEEKAHDTSKSILTNIIYYPILNNSSDLK